MIKNKCLYSGKVKSLYQLTNPNELLVEFRNDVSAFDGEKTDTLENRGTVLNHFNAFIMEKLQAAGIQTHFVRREDATHSVVKHLKMIPVECVVRNVAAGSLTRRLGIEEGTELNPPLVEFFLKNDALHDPMITHAHMEAFGWATRDQANEIEARSIQVNALLKPLFAAAGLRLVDFKLEFGMFNGELLLGDELTPDACRLWDVDSGAIMDKDVFRKDIGDVVETYLEVSRRLGMDIPLSG